MPYESDTLSRARRFEIFGFTREQSAALVYAGLEVPEQDMRGWLLREIEKAEKSHASTDARLAELRAELASLT